ncbi:DEAD/DEAH box helicase [Aurantimicrobium sp. MWH-Uga1]|uniref:DEAD/DEAH box helicase n=1 Tax=Aurantimicrobium sp. MWH-Uga1 TaxID=2079575 RepID=UPI000DEDDFEF|nr:DEAD/DEAH box helicase [Aurantimicrobium sp. MWH-Uga1]AXE54479.1 Type III restriction enzyme, res subunit [Aurantimicrobium sp. MWH-Uga1]
MTGETTHIGSFAAEHLSPAYPARAPWGTADNLRAWQTEALDAYFRHEPKDFLAAATPGAGKTTFALRLATELFRRRVIDRITVVTPTEHLKTQWADAAHKVGIRLDPHFTNAHKRHGKQFHGVAVTYAQIAMKAHVHKDLTESARTLVILDEVHHGGDTLSWGDGIREAFSRAERRLSLTGTPFRSDTAPIPFVSYLPNRDGVLVSQTDYDYGYGRALQDGVVRPVMFMVYAGSMRWRTRAGDEMEARLGQDNTKDVTSQAWRAALDPSGDWIPQVLTAANSRLSEVRHSIPDAAGLVIATDQDDARAYARILHTITGEQPTVVLSDEVGGSQKIEEFSLSNNRWMVAVRMVSEGVDVPRLAVGVYATSASTPLYFAQAVGRFVRARRRGETASIFLPNVPSLLALAQELELQRDHALERRSSAAESDNPEMIEFELAQREEQASSQIDEEFNEFAILGSDANFDMVMFQGEEFGGYAEPGSLEEHDFIGIPGLLEPEQIADLLRFRQRRQAQRGSGRSRDVAENRSIPLHRSLKEQRALLNSLVALWSKQTNTPHGIIHTELRQTCGGPPVAQATVAQLQARIDLMRRRISSPVK